MTSADMTELLKALALLSVFLLIGTFLRAKIKLFQNTFLPASVIGGFLLLILGPYVLNVLPLPESWMSAYSAIPGVLIIPIVAAGPLGARFTSGGSKARNYRIAQLVMLMCILTAAQLVIGFGVNLGFRAFGYPLYDAFGWELNMGYVGGHGTAGLLASLLQGVGDPNWEVAQGVATTMATIGLVGGIVIGIALINWAARRGESACLDKPGMIPMELKVGFIKQPDKQASMGRETTLSASVDAYAFHLALILGVCGASYLVQYLVGLLNNSILSGISVWAYAMLLMFLVWWIIQKLKLDYLVDVKVKGKVAGSMTDFAVIAAVASLNISAVSAYLVPMLVMAVLGMVGTILVLIFFAHRMFKREWFEHMIAVFGQGTGVFLTGVLLLRICDPDNQTEALNNYSIAYTFSGVITQILMPVYAIIISTFGTVVMFGQSVAQLVVWTLISVILWMLVGKKLLKNQEL